MSTLATIEAVDSGGHNGVVKAAIFNGPNQTRDLIKNIGARIDPLGPVCVPIGRYFGDLEFPPSVIFTESTTGSPKELSHRLADIFMVMGPEYGFYGLSIIRDGEGPSKRARGLHRLVQVHARNRTIIPGEVFTSEESGLTFKFGKTSFSELEHDKPTSAPYAVHELTDQVIDLIVEKSLRVAEDIKSGKAFAAEAEQAARIARKTALIV